MATEYLSAGDAIEALKIPASTFFRLVKEKKIKKYYPTPVSKHGLYSAKEIARLSSKFKHDSEPQEIGATDWVKSSDVGNIYNLEYPVYGDETGNPSIIRKWYEHNPYICRILYNQSDRHDLWGAINMVPLKEDCIFKLLRGEIRDIDLDPQTDILMFDKLGVYNFYVASVIVHPQRKQHFPLLINSLFDFWCEKAPEQTIGKMYGRVVSEDGELMAKKLFFSPIWHISDVGYMLDLSKPNPSRLIQSFQYCVKSRSENHEENLDSSDTKL